MVRYDLDKYRVKREKVLGVRQRSISFGTLAATVSMAIILGLSVVVIPKSIAFFHGRHLEDAIFKVPAEQRVLPNIVNTLRSQHGVRDITVDGDGSRIVITFNRAETDPGSFAAFFAARRVDAVLLNQVGHSQHKKILEKEARFEAL